MPSLRLRPAWVALFLVVALASGSGCTTAWAREMRYGGTALWAGDAPRAAGHFERAAALAEDDDERRATALSALGHSLQRAGRAAEAERSLRQALLLLEHRYGTEHPILVPTLAGLAPALREDPARGDEADAMLDRVVASHCAQPEWSPEDAWPRFVLGRGFAETGGFLLRAHRQAEAEELFERAMPLLLETNPKWRSIGQTALYDYAEWLRTTGRADQADALQAPAWRDPDYQGGSEAPLDLLYLTMLHEMGHMPSASPDTAPIPATACSRASVRAARSSASATAIAPRCARSTQRRSATGSLGRSA